MPRSAVRFRRTLAVSVAFISLLFLLPAHARGDGCLIVNPATPCDVCKNSCCDAYNRNMQACRVIRFLCRLVFDDECAGYVLCALEAQHDLDICNAMCQSDYPNCY